MIIYLIRHAESQGNISGKFNGITDLPLSENGRTQATLLGSFFKDRKIDRIYTSKLTRTNETADLALPGRVDEFIKMEDLNEINGGDWEGVEWEIIMDKWGDEFSKWNDSPEFSKLPNGESTLELYERSVKALKRIINENDDDGAIAVFSHGTVLKAFIAYARELPVSSFKDIAWYENSSVTKLLVENKKLSIDFFDNHEHLPDEIKTVANSPWGCNMKLTCKY